jgi:hypothetical protein
VASHKESTSLVVRSSKTSAHILVIKYLDFKSEVLLHIFNDEDQERKLDTQALLGISRAAYVVGAHIGGH